jgi:hypothetical protein
MVQPCTGPVRKGFWIATFFALLLIHSFFFKNESQNDILYREATIRSMGLPPLEFKRNTISIEEFTYSTILKSKHAEYAEKYIENQIRASGVFFKTRKVYVDDLFPSQPLIKALSSLIRKNIITDVMFLNSTCPTHFSRKLALEVFESDKILGDNNFQMQDIISDIIALRDCKTEYCIYFNPDIAIYSSPNYSWVKEGKRILDESNNIFFVSPRTGYPLSHDCKYPTDIDFKEDETIRGDFVIKNYFSSWYYMTKQSKLETMFPLVYVPKQKFETSITISFYETGNVWFRADIISCFKTITSSPIPYVWAVQHTTPSAELLKEVQNNKIQEEKKEYATY